MRLVVAAAVVLILLALGALEIFATRTIADTDASGAVAIDTWRVR